MSDITIPHPNAVNGHTAVIYLFHKYQTHPGCTKEYTTANRHAYPATDRNLSTDGKYWR